jgi:hypothetical protein
MSLRACLLPCLLLGSLSAHAQDALPAPSGQWQPDEKQNERLFKQAEDDFRAKLHERWRQHGGEGGRRGGMGAPDGPPPGAGGIHGGGMRGGGGHGFGGGRGAPGLAGLLPPELAFAAPADDVLIVQRMRDAVAFARAGNGDAATLVPIAGASAGDAALDLGNGVRATARDEAGTLVLDATAPSGLHVRYRYLVPADKPGTLDVRIAIDGRMDDGIEVERVYRRADVKVGAPAQR